MESAQPAPFIVLEANGDLSEATAGLAQQGWRLRSGWTLPDDPWDVRARREVCAGVVASDADTHAALLAAVRGAGVVVAPPPGQAEVPAAFLADLARVGPIEFRRTGRPDPLAGLDRDQRALLAALASGDVIAKAAQRAHLSLRAAERKLAAARQTLGARTTAEAVVQFVVRTTG